MTSKQTDTGGPAFPEIGNVAYNSDWQSESGMTRRDYFAAKALVALGTWMPVPHKELTSPSALRARALLAYQQADAMLAVSEETMEGGEA